jgi:hypothetical protein
MWVFLNDCFFSIVHKDCAPDELLVRARREGDIQKVFPRAPVIKLPHADYLFRTTLKRAVVEQAIVGELRRVTYRNFKDAVPHDDDKLHDAYLRVWCVMANLQPTRPSLFADLADEEADGEFGKRGTKKRKKRGRK